MNNLCIIPARGGSKRIPHKNIKEFIGKPIISYPIEIALSCGLFNEIMVSTDDLKIADIAEKLGAKVPFMRTKKNADDFSPLSEVINEVLKHYSNNGDLFDNVCCILPTAVFLSKDLLLKALKLLLTDKFDSVRPIQKFSYPIQRAYKILGDQLSYINPEFSKTRSQDLESSYHDAGMFYWIKTNAINNNQKWGWVLISELESHDIDEENDWEIAELKYRLIMTIKENADR